VFTSIPWAAWVALRPPTEAAVFMPWAVSLAAPEASSSAAVGSREDLAPCRCEACLDKAGDRVGIEPMSDREQLLDAAVRNSGEQRQRTALFTAEVSWGRQHPPTVSESFAGDGRAANRGLKSRREDAISLLSCREADRQESHAVLCHRD
jgi:hypothetical protein